MVSRKILQIGVKKRHSRRSLQASLHMKLNTIGRPGDQPDITSQFKLRLPLLTFVVTFCGHCKIVTGTFAFAEFYLVHVGVGWTILYVESAKF